MVLVLFALLGLVGWCSLRVWFGTFYWPLLVVDWDVGVLGPVGLGALRGLI